MKKNIIKVILCTIFLLLLYGLLENFLIETNTYKIPFNNLPSSWNNLKILVITDIHCKYPFYNQWLSYIIKKANTIDKDIVVCLGDYLQSNWAEKDFVKAWQYFDQLKAPLGVYMVLGNHDHQINYSLSVKMLEESNKSLRFTKKYIQRSNSQIVIGGMGVLGLENSQIKNTLQDVSDDLFKIMLAHSPDSSDMPHDKRVDLFICGHSHGGQIILPFINKPLYFPLINKSYVKGITCNSKNETIFISKGLGCWAIIPFRFNCRPEFAVLQLMKSKE